MFFAGFDANGIHSVQQAQVTRKAGQKYNRECDQLERMAAAKGIKVELRRVAHWSPPRNNFLLQTLVDPALRWELH